MAVAALAAQAQNVQLHYDFGRNLYSDQESDRQKVTVTLEQFKADKWGSWYYFVDVDFSRKFTESAYTEISREFNLGKQSPFAFHIEYNGGLNRFGSFQQSALAGFAYNGHTADFSKTWSVQLMYKRYFKIGNQGSVLNYYDTFSSYAPSPVLMVYSNPEHEAYHSLQLTGVWGLNFAKNKCTFSGFIDFWRGEKYNGHGQLVVLSEPQFWYNATEHFSIGTEVEFSNHFIYNTYDDQSFFVNPTLAVKWNF